MCFPQRGKPDRCSANSWPSCNKTHPQRLARKGGGGSSLEKNEKVDFCPRVFDSRFYLFSGPPSSSSPFLALLQ